MSRRTRRFLQLDVFASGPLSGNPLAVVVDGDGLADATMARFANWTNLSETTFLLPPTDSAADYRVRIFTTTTELPFAGHPTLGSCHAWLAAGGRPRGRYVVQQCTAGLVRVRQQSDGGLAFAAPPLKRKGPVDEAQLARVANWLRVPREHIVDHQWADNGPGWCAVMLASAEAVIALKPDFANMGHANLGVVGPYPPGGEAAFEVRAFFPSPTGTQEDPVTGSLNAALAQWLIGSGRAGDRYVASQGTALGRRGRVRVERDGDDVWIGGDSTILVDGTVTL